jgi:hypothetical protein
LADFGHDLTIYKHLTSGIALSTSGVTGGEGQMKMGKRGSLKPATPADATPLGRRAMAFV